MQSIVILFCAVLFYSQIVDSISRHESRPQKRRNPPSNWHDVQNEPNNEYTHFIPTRNVITPENLAINLESTQNYFPNQGLYNVDGYFDNIRDVITPASSSLSGPDHISDLQKTGGRVDYSPIPIVKSYPSEVGFDDQQLINKIWLPQSHFSDFASNSVPIPTDNGSPSFSSVQEPDERPLPYFAPTKRRDNRPRPTNRYGDGFVVNSGFRSSGQERPYENDYRTPSDLIGTGDSTNYDSNYPVISEKYNYRSEPESNKESESYNERQSTASAINTKPNPGRRFVRRLPTQKINIGKKANINTLSGTSQPRKNAPIYRSDSGARKMDDSYDGIPTGIKERSGNYENVSSGSTPSNTNLNHNIYERALEMKDIKLNKLVKEPEMQNILAKSNSRFMILHPNGTVENVDEINLDAHQNSKIHLVNTKRENVAVTEGDGTQSPDIVQNNIAKVSVPEDKSSLPTNNQPALVNQTNPADESNSNLPIKDLPGDQSNLNTLTPLVNQPEQVNDINSTSPRENKPAVDKITLPLTEIQPEDTLHLLHPNRTIRREKFQPSQGNPPAEGNDSSQSNPNENQLSDDTNAKPLPSKANQSENESNSKPSVESQLGDDNKSKPLRLYETQSTGDSNPTLPGGSATEEQSDSTTFSPTAPNDTTSPKPKKIIHRHHYRSTTSSPIVYSTTPSSEKTSEDQFITLSPIEQVTDNVSDVQPVTTTTTTAKPIETLGKTDTNKDDHNKQDDEQKDASSPSEVLATTLDTDISQTSTTTSPSSSTTPTVITTDDKTTKETAESKDTQINDKAIKSQGNNGKNDIQTVQSAVYVSSELLDTSTDVPAESDDYSPVTTSPSVHNDVDSGDASGVNTIELEQPETDVTITVSSSKANDSEDEIITINIEISESTGLSGNNKTLIISIDTNNDVDDDAKIPKSSGSGNQSSDCNKDHDDGRGKNLEIDISNIQGEPTIWIKTTNHDLIDKLADKNDTSFDIIYFFNNVNQPVIERVKETTIHCNGTVVIESKDITYANKDDPTPTITKTTQTIQIEDYKRFGLDLSEFSD